MGVYNPNMEMPRNCTECIEFKDDCDHYWDYYCTHESRPSNCPLIEIDEPKVGKWIDHKEIIYTDPEIWGYSQECSLCGFTLGAKEYNYCPNCGAKMERRADET